MIYFELDRIAAARRANERLVCHITLALRHPRRRNAAFCGKLPSRGDVLRVGLPRSFTDPRDAWLLSCLPRSRSATPALPASTAPNQGPATEGVLRPRHEARAVWWTRGAPWVPPMRLSTSALPGPATFTGMLHASEGGGA